jgi:RNase P subunit RPR2
MTTKNDASRPICKHCNAAVGGDDVVVRHSLDDPLQVSECANCGSVVSVTGHRW